MPRGLVINILQNQNFDSIYGRGNLISEPLKINRDWLNIYRSVSHRLIC